MVRPAAKTNRSKSKKRKNTRKRGAGQAAAAQTDADVLQQQNSAVAMQETPVRSQ